MFIQDIDRQINNLQDIRDTLMNTIKPSDNIDTIILKKYIEVESITETMKYINGSGHRKEKNGQQIKFTVNDISNKLKDKMIDVEVGVKVLAQNIFANHKRGGKRRW